jgi:hypothetical protein
MLYAVGFKKSAVSKKKLSAISLGHLDQSVDERRRLEQHLDLQYLIKIYTTRSHIFVKKSCLIDFKATTAESVFENLKARE